MSLKQVQFSMGNPRFIGTAVYMIRKDMCTFSALTKLPSSINAAEDLVKSICRAEHCRPTQLHFFDLQTCLGYSSMQPGDYELELLKLKVLGAEITCTGWEPYWCPVEIHEAFFPYILGLA